MGHRQTSRSFDHLAFKLLYEMFWKLHNSLLFGPRPLQERDKADIYCLNYLCWYTKKGTIFHNRPQNQFINIISDIFSQLPFLLFQCRSLFFLTFFPPNSEQQLVSAPLKRALQCCQVIVLHTLAYSWGKTFLCSLVRCICAFYKLRGCLGQSAVCRGSLLWLMAWSFYKRLQPNEKEQKAFVCGGLNGQRQLNRKLHFWCTGCI